MKNSDSFLSPCRHRFLDERGPLGFGWVAGVLGFVVLSGFAIWWMPFSVGSQMNVLLHTLLGLLVLVPIALWQLSHWLATRKSPRNLRKICAYTGFWLLAASMVSGLVITWQGLFALHVVHYWHLVHLWSSIGALPFLGYHFYPHTAPAMSEPSADSSGAPPDYGPARRRMWTRLAVTCSALCLLPFIATWAYRNPSYASYEPPARYLPKMGENPFAPSLAMTESGRPIAPEILGNSSSCGQAMCHTAIYREWQASAHHWTAEDEFFQAVRSATTEVQGRHITEKCGACHEPVSLLAGYKDPTLGSSAPGYKEGDSCMVCHAVRKVEERGIGSYVLGVPKPYLFEYSHRPNGRLAAGFLIRAYPEQHNRDYSLALVREAQSCAPCHKEFDVLDKRLGPVQVETQYDDWKRGKWNRDADARKHLRCQQCHMYFENATAAAEADPYDVKIGLGSKHRSHYFAAGNQFMPAALHSPDAAGQVRRINEWLRGEQVVPEIAEVWPRGPLVTLKIQGPSSVRPGSTLAMQVVLTNNKVGHSFPTGPLNIGRAWIELRVHDGAGREIFHSGALDHENHVEAGSYVLRPIAITTSGQDVVMPDIWHPVGPKFRAAVLPGHADTYSFTIKVPRGAQRPLRLDARLLYRKANQFFMDSVYTGQTRRAPVTEISSDHLEVGFDGTKAAR